MVNIMFYGVPEDPKLQNLELGTVQISTTTILIGVEASLISVPLSLIIVTLFRYARPRYVAFPDPLLTHSDSSLQFIASRMLTSIRSNRIVTNLGKLRHLFSQERLEINRVPIVLEMSSSSSTKSSWASGSEILSTPSSKLSYGNNLPLAAIECSSRNGGDDIKAAGLVVPIGEDDDVSNQWSVNIEDNSGTSGKPVEEGLSQQHSVQAGDSKDAFAKFDSKIELLDQNQLGNRIDNLEGVNSPHQQESMTSLQSKDSNDKVSSSTSWDLSDDTVKYETHQDYLGNKLNQCREFIYNMPVDGFTTKRGHRRVRKKLDIALTMHGWEETSQTSESEHHMDDNNDQGCLPWWIIYVAWGLTLSSSIVCAFFIMLYGLRYGRQASMEWLVAMVVGLVQSVVVIQPIKVVIMAAVFAIALKTHELDDVGAQFYRNWRPPKSKYLFQ